MRHTTLAHIHPDAPPQPALGAPCNGCGLCAKICPTGAIGGMKFETIKRVGTIREGTAKRLSGDSRKEASEVKRS